MSGWIKFEKDLRDDPRVFRMARALERRLGLFEVDEQRNPCNACALPAVTLVLGALAQLWALADSHAENDVLNMGADEIDAYLGIPGFCDLMPADWLRVIDDHSVELPDFQAHNGPDAKKRAATQKRVERHRARNAGALQARNADALPDKTRQDYIHTHRERAPETRKETEGARTPEMSDCAKLAKPLREAGVQVTSMHPYLVAWVSEGFTLEQAMQAVAVAREYIKPPEPIPAKYLDKVLRNPPAPPAGNGRARMNGGGAHAELVAALNSLPPVAGNPS